MEKMIALVINNGGGLVSFRKELIDTLANAGYRLLISCPYDEKLEQLKPVDFIYDRVEIDRRGTNPLTDAKLFLHYKRLFKLHRPDIVLTYTAKPNVYAGKAAQMLRIPVITNITGFGSVLEKKGLLSAFILGLFKTVYRHASCLMFQNEANMMLAEKRGMVPPRYKLIPGSGVNTERFTAQPYPAGGDGKTGETVIFNYIGRVLHEKGIDDYIAAAKRIKALYPNTEFNVIGDIEPTEAHYRADFGELEQKGIICYRGRQNDVRPFLARAHALIHPSVYGEGMSNVLLENAATARPQITTDNVGCKETVVDGASGFIYKGGESEALIEKIERFLAMPNENRAQMGLYGRDFVKTHFERTIVVKAYMDEIAWQLANK